MEREYSDEIVKDAWLGTKPSSKGENAREIFKIWVPEEHRRKHTATRMLKQVTDDADREGVTLYATPIEDNKVVSTKLLMNSGFEFIRSIGGEEMSEMIRRPLL